MRVLLLLDRAAAPVGGVEQLPGELLDHRLLGARAGVLHQPADGERRPARRPHLDRNLVGGAADAARAHLDDRLRRLEGALEHREGVLLGPLGHQVERPVDDALRDAALSVAHHAGHELRDHAVPVLRVRQHVSALDFTFAWHADATSAVGRTRRGTTRPCRHVRGLSPRGYLGLLAPYFERPWRRSWTPIESSVPRMMW